jgi:hypothetical protein
MWLFFEGMGVLATQRLMPETVHRSRLWKRTASFVSPGLVKASPELKIDALSFRVAFAGWKNRKRGREPGVPDRSKGMAASTELLAGLI